MAGHEALDTHGIVTNGFHAERKIPNSQLVEVAGEDADSSLDDYARAVQLLERACSENEQLRDNFAQVRQVSLEFDRARSTAKPSASHRAGCS